MKTPPEGATLFQVDGRTEGQTDMTKLTEGQTDMTKLIVTSHNFVNAPKKNCLWLNSPSGSRPPPC